MQRIKLSFEATKHRNDMFVAENRVQLKGGPRLVFLALKGRRIFKTIT